MNSRLKPHLFAISILLLAGCGSDPGFDERAVFERKEGAAQFVNMIPDSPELTVIHGISRSLATFGVASPVELRFEDEYNWEIGYFNNNNDFKQIKEGKDQQVLENHNSVFLLMGSVAQPQVQVNNIELVPIDQRPADTTSIWFAANLSNYPMIDVYLTAHGTALATSSPFTSVDSGGFTSLFSVPAGPDQQIRITSAGSQDVLFDSGAIEIPAQGIILFAAVDDFGPDGANHIDLIASESAVGGFINDISQRAAIRATNLSSITSLDVDFGGTLFEDTGAVRGGFSELPGGTLTFTVTDNGAETESANATLAAGRFQSFYTFDSSDGTAGVTRSLIGLDDLRPIVDRSQFLFISGNSATIDFYALREGVGRDDVPPVFSSASFGASNSAEVRTGNIRFQVTTPNTNDLLTTLETRLEAGTFYTVIYDSAGELQIYAD